MTLKLAGPQLDTYSGAPVERTVTALRGEIRSYELEVSMIFRSGAFLPQKESLIANRTAPESHSKT